MPAPEANLILAIALQERKGVLPEKALGTPRDHRSLLVLDLLRFLSNRVRSIAGHQAW